MGARSRSRSRCRGRCSVHDATCRSQFLRRHIASFSERMCTRGGVTYVRMCKPVQDLRGEVWAELTTPREVTVGGGATYLIDVRLWHGESLERSTELVLHRGSANEGQALIFNWPRAGNRGRIIVSRMLGMSRMYDPSVHGFARYADELVVHHRCEQHRHSLLSNLEIVRRGPHAAHHNRTRPRRR